MAHVQGPGSRPRGSSRSDNPKAARAGAGRRGLVAPQPVGAALSPSFVSLSAQTGRGFCGAAAGALCAAVCSPLDVARTRLQVQATISVAGAGAGAGAGGADHGAGAEAGPTKGGGGPAKGAGGGPGTVGGAPRSRVFVGALQRAASSATAHASAVAAPRSTHYDGLVSALWSIGREEGVRGYFAGLSTSMVIVPAFWSLYFVNYEFNKAELSRRFGVGTDSALVQCTGAVGAAVVADFVTNPLWVVRTRLQTQALHAFDTGAAVYRGTWHALAHIYRHEGVRALYKGLTASMVGTSHVAVQFPLYEHLLAAVRRRKAAKLEASGEWPPLAPGQPARDGRTLPLNAVELVLASSCSKLAASMLTYPHEVVRARLQDQRDPIATRARQSKSAATVAAEAEVVTQDIARHTRYRGFAHAVRVILREEGWRALYAGFSANLLRAVPACAVTFTSYSYMMQYLRDAGIVQAGEAAGDEEVEGG